MTVPSNLSRSQRYSPAPVGKKMCIRDRVGAVGFGIAMGLLFILGAETIDYSEWKTGIRPQGLMTAFMGFMVKIGMAVSGLSLIHI